MEVTLPVRSITYDVVSNPSHGTARIMSFLSENQTIDGLSSMLMQQDELPPLLEGLDSLLFESEMLCTPGSSKEECSIYLKTLLTEHFNTLKTFNFKI